MKDSVFMDRFYFKGNIGDDYGFKKLTFIYAILNDKDTLSDKKTIDIPIDLSLNGQDFYYYFDAQTLNLNLGQPLTYYFEVWDNDGVNGTNRAVHKAWNMLYLPEKEIQKHPNSISSQTKSKHGTINEKKAEKILKDIDDLKKKNSWIRINLTGKKRNKWDPTQTIARHF
jgi:hypothetical protein